MLEEAEEAGTAARSLEHGEVIRRLFQKHHRALIRFLIARLHSEHDAHDIAQEAYLRLLQLENVAELDFLRAYLFKTAMNLAIDRSRRRSMRNHYAVEDFYEELVDPHAPERQLQAQQQLELVGRRLEALPAPCRHAFAMHVLLERPVREIAAELGVTERMVRYYIVRAMLFCGQVMGEPR